MSTRTAPRPPWYRELNGQQWKSFIAAWIGYVLDGFDFVLITLVLTEIADEFQLSTVQAASLISGAFITRWLGGAILGAMGDRYGRRLGMVVSILLYSLGTLACGFAWDYTSLFIARLFIGMGMAGEYSASATYVLESWPSRIRNRASGFLISGYSFGSVLASEAYKVVVPNLGWRWLFFVGVIPVLIALWMRRALPEAEDWSRDVGDSAEQRPNPFRPLFANRRMSTLNTVLIVVATGTLFCAFTPVGTGLVAPLSVIATACLLAFGVQMGGRRRWLLFVTLMATVFFAFLYSWPIQSLLPTYLKSELHYSPDQVTDVMFFAGFGTMAGCWMAGFVGDWIGTRRAYAYTLLASLVFVFPVFAVQDNLLLLGTLLFVLLGLSQGISGLLPKYIAGHFPTESRAANLGFTYNVGSMGGAVAPVLGAKLSSGMSLGHSLAFLTFGLTGVVIICVGGNLPNRLNRLLDKDGTEDYLVDTSAAENPANPDGSEEMGGNGNTSGDGVPALTDAAAAQPTSIP